MVTELESLVSDRLKASQAQIAKFCQRWKITELALFGSVLREDFHPNSDIDVLVTFSPGVHLSLFELVNLQSELKDLFQRDVDVILKTSIQSSTNYLRRRRILASAKPIYSTQSQISIEPLNSQLKSTECFTKMDRDQSLLLDMILAGRKIHSTIRIRHILGKFSAKYTDSGRFCSAVGSD
ncbi:MAG: nucleotidyltransferase family protein [Leptolyngbyaceae cyanobacterium HOT.MB2.61]|nr:nucleotidyltransferase family protein [Leptolyngbyaceae cyanobacterium HOT.MB2.61]